MNITIQTTVKASPQQAWEAWTSPASITQWNFASDDWQCPRAQLDLRPGGTFNYRMEAKDGSMGFDFEGKFTVITPHQLIEYALGDDRKVRVEFLSEGDSTRVVETFEADNEFSAEQQRQGWQAILDNFKKYAEAR
jgi:uncharacterized protein YndB with AHSA1/START domain